MSKQWLEPEEITPPPELAQAIGGHPLVAQTLARRGILDPATGRAFINPAFYTPADPSDLPGLSNAVERINRAIEVGETILVWGDFDVDGQTSTTLLVEALHDLGARVVYHIPVRASEGHGIQPEVLRALLDPSPPHPHPYPPDPSPFPPNPSLLLTCDTGIAEFDAVDLAHALNLDVIITDHHQPQLDAAGKLHLPQAEAVINPHLLPDGHPLRSLPGVGVAYKLVECLYRSQGRADEEVEPFLDLVALGIVADVAEQVDDTRYLLQRGLNVLRQNNRLGLAALLGIAEISLSSLDESNIGFGIAPRLNAIGRLGDANPVVEFFTTQDPDRAAYLAQHLDNLNLERRMHTERITQSALDILRLDPGLQAYSALVLAQPGWHTGILGIVASRLVERFGLPTVLLNIGEDGIARGSARSVEGLNLAEAIEAQADLLIGWGGHAGAAGMSLEEKHIPEFRARLSRTVKSMTAHLDLQPTVAIDTILPLAEVDLSLVDELERLAPFGAGNPQPILVSYGLKLVSATPIGRESEHLRLVVEDPDQATQEFLWWRGAGEPQPAKEEFFDLAYHASSSTFQGLRRLQLEWVDYHPREALPAEFGTRFTQRSLVDYRDQPDPLRLVKALQSRGEVQVWAEGSGREQVSGLRRDQLQPANTLVIWTAPPSYRTLEWVVNKVNPEEVYFFAIPPQLDHLKPFLQRLAGLVKTVINRMDGRITLGALAGAMAHPSDTVKVGLRRLQAMGILRFETAEHPGVWEAMAEDEHLRLIPVKGTIAENLDEIDAVLNAMLAETAAFRSYCRTTDLEALFRF